MRAKNYKHLLHKLSLTNKIIVTISIWTHRSRRMFFKLDFGKNHHIFNRDMDFNYQFDKDVMHLSFETIYGEKLKFDRRKIRIAKVDSIELQNTN